MNAAKRYRTSHLELASYLHGANLAKLVGTETNGPMVEFIFDISPERGLSLAQQFYDGALMPAQALFASLKTLRSMIHKQRAFNKQFQGASLNVYSATIHTSR